MISFDYENYLVIGHLYYTSTFFMVRGKKRKRLHFMQPFSQLRGISNDIDINIMIQVKF